MINQFLRVLNDSPKDVLNKIRNMYIFLIASSILAWAIAFLLFRDYPLLIGTCLIAYTFGLRHAVDADHIAAIDNVTRKLMQDGKKPISVGFFFALGHSTIVVLMSVAIVVSSITIKKYFPGLREIGGLIGTSVSAAFLLLIAVINMIVLWDVYSTFKRVQRGEVYDEASLDEFLDQRGVKARFFRPILRMINSSWKMYPLGVIFGLGFDTATEVGILGIAASQASKGMPIWSILVFPALFTVGMCLVDTTDGIMMIGAYGWAQLKPIRKLYYNITITTVSILVALVIGTIEVLSIVVDRYQLKGPFWDFVGNLSENFGIIGYLVIALFVLSWLISTVIYKVKRYDEIKIKITRNQD